LPLTFPLSDPAGPTQEITNPSNAFSIQPINQLSEPLLNSVTLGLIHGNQLAQLITDVMQTL
jgi:hypothetical protein